MAHILCTNCKFTQFCTVCAFHLYIFTSICYRSGQTCSSDVAGGCQVWRLDYVNNQHTICKTQFRAGIQRACTINNKLVWLQGRWICFVVYKSIRNCVYLGCCQKLFMKAIRLVYLRIILFRNPCFC